MNYRKILPISLLAALILGVIVLAFPGGSVAAQTPTPQPKDPQALAARVNARLERLFKAEQRMLKRQAANLDRLDQLTTRVSNLIATAKANGKDTAALETALAAFKAKLTEIRKVHDSAANVIAAHAGFDENGKVTDRALARDTITSARGLLRDVRQAVVKAARDFRMAVKDWRAANSPQASK